MQLGAKTLHIAVAIHELPLQVRYQCVSPLLVNNSPLSCGRGAGGEGDPIYRRE